MGLALPGFYGFAGADPNSPRKTDLKAWWTFNEESGERADSHGSNNLTDNATVLYAAGKVGNAADFELDLTEYLSIANNTDLSVGNIDFLITLWVNLETKTSGQITGKDDVDTNREYWLDYDSGVDRFRFYVSDDGQSSGLTLVVADNLGNVSTGTWYFIVVWHDATANTINIQVNNGTVDSMAHSTGVYNGTSFFAFGARDKAASRYPYDGLIDEPNFWKKVLSANERTWFYNGGNGRTYTDL